MPVAAPICATPSSPLEARRALIHTIPAAQIDADDVLEVVGRGTVMIIDGAHMHSNVAHARAHTPLSVTDVVLHALGNGYRYDLATRRPLPSPPIRLSKRDQRRLARAGLRLEEAGAADDGAASGVTNAQV